MAKSTKTQAATSEVAMPDLSGYDLPDLKKLQKMVDKAIVNFEAQKKNAAMAAAEEAAKSMGFSLADLLKDSGAGSKKPKAAPKYADPTDPTKTWTGRGRKPAWIASALDEGKSLDEFLIAAE